MSTEPKAHVYYYVIGSPVRYAIGFDYKTVFA